MQAEQQPPVDEEDRAPDTFRPATVPPPAPSAAAKKPLFRGGVRTAVAFFLGIASGLLAPSTVKVVEGLLRNTAHVAREGIVAPVLPSEPSERADAKLDRRGRTPIAGGLMAIPQAFHSADGQFDVVIHLHGNTDLVEDSFAVAKVNAPVVIMNLGLGSGPYEDRFSSPDLFREVLARVGFALEKRGLVEPKRRRIALTSWSAGYGGIVRILENPALAEMVDAVILLDGIHAAYLHNSRNVDPLRMGPYEKFARQALRGDKLLVITHSDIEPYTYAGSKITSDALLKMMDLARTPGGTPPVMPALSSLHGVPKSKVMALKPQGELHEGSLHVRAFNGETPEHHMMHLLYMADLGLPELAARWNR